MKCLDCLTEHPPNDFPWKKYDVPVYWDLSDDGAIFKCRDCKEDKSYKDVYLTQIPCGHRLTICKECIDKYWLSIAKYLGKFND